MTALHNIISDTVIVEGIFYIRQEILGVSDINGFRSVEEILEPLKDKYVKALLQYIVDPAAPRGSWGLGSCLWKDLGECPFGHRFNPVAMLDWSQEGYLCKSGGVWCIRGSEQLELPLKYLDGHNCRMVIISIMPRQVTEETKRQDLVGQVGNLLNTLKSLKK